MRVGLITTLNTNIGDDFIREGLCNVLRQLVPADSALEFVAINKHEPHTVYPSSHPFARIRSFSKRKLFRRISRLFRHVGSNKFQSCDFIIQCGAPVYWPRCHLTDWRRDLWEAVVEPLHKKIPVLNLAAGSCYPLRDQPECFNPADASYMRWLHGICRETSVRDPLAQKLLNREGCEAELICCSAFLFTSPANAEANPDGPVLINYMKGGGHYDWGQNVDAARWEKTVRELIARLQKRHRVVMLCHDAKELELAREIAPQCQNLLPETYNEFPRLVAGAKAALCNRIHASVALCGMGIPAVTVGTDSRLLMAAELGLPCHYVDDTSVDELESELEQAITGRQIIASRLALLQRDTTEKYARILRRALPVLQKN